MIKSFLYKLLDLATLKTGIPVRVNNFRLRLPARYYRYFSKTYEVENFRFFLTHSKEGMVTLDIGAHFGLFSIFFQKSTGGVVYAFEPTRSTNKVLKKTVRLNNCTNTVKVFDMAIDEAPSTAEFFLSDIVGGRANTLVQNSKLSHASESYTVVVTSVDTFVRERNLSVGCIKIDAEGAELGVLKGAGATIRKDNPIILLSLHPEPIRSRGDTLKEIWVLIESYGYKVLSCDTGEVLNENLFCEATELFDVHLLPIDHSFRNANSEFSS
jgi:FkbM family methyltransferase